MIAIGCAILVAIQDQLHLQGNQIEKEVPHLFIVNWRENLIGLII